MTRLRLLAYRDLKLVAEACDFHWVRREGSHNTFRNPSGRITVIPDHGSHVIVRPLLRKIIRDLGITVDEYNKIVNKVL